jgi:hypothetical protein
LLCKDCFQWRTIVRFIDMNNSFHANQSVYIKFCFDCATTASLSENFVHLSGDINGYPVLSIFKMAATIPQQFNIVRFQR